MDLAEVWGFLNDSQFVRTILSSLAGAGIGAFTAQWIVARNKETDERLKEVRAAHAAATLAYSAITDVFISVKRQNVKPMNDKYEKERAEFIARVKNRKPDEVIDFHADMQTMDIVRVPLEALQRLLFDRVNAPTRAISLMGVVDRTVHGLNNYIKARNDLCDEFRKNGAHPAVYYGLITPNGADERYRSTLKAIQTYTDDLIHFGMLLGNDLMKYANAEKGMLPKRQQKLAPIIVSANFDKGADMIPDPGNYPDWETMFVAAEKPPGLHFWTSWSPEECA
jgi:hypothetical protein